MKKIIIYNSCFILILLIFTEFLTGNYLFNKSKIDCVYICSVDKNWFLKM